MESDLGGRKLWQQTSKWGRQVWEGGLALAAACLRGGLVTQAAAACRLAAQRTGHYGLAGDQPMRPVLNVLVKSQVNW